MHQTSCQENKIEKVRKNKKYDIIMMVIIMHTIMRESRITYVIQKSEFIASLKPVESVSEAKAFFEQIKEEFSDATHNITAYTIGKTGEAGHYSDDGEPSGTAGLPVLDVFRKNDITNFACVVTRYYGGIKLGAGGLVRAYSTSASLALKEAGICEIIDYEVYRLTFDYSYLDLLENRLKDYQIINREFSTMVKMVIKLPKHIANQMLSLLIDLTNNMIRIETCMTDE